MFSERRFSIPRWLLIAMAALLAVAIFVIVVHPYYDVSNATVADRLAALLLAIVQVLGTAMACVLVMLHVLPAVIAQPQPLRIMERRRVRRI
jgi:hypothetical protein